PLGSSCWLLAVQDWLPDVFCAIESCAKPNSTVTEKSAEDLSSRRNNISRNPSYFYHYMLPDPLAASNLQPAKEPAPKLKERRVKSRFTPANAPASTPEFQPSARWSNPSPAAPAPCACSPDSTAARDQPSPPTGSRA